MSQHVWGMQTKKERIHERIWKKDRKCMSEVDKQKTREYIKEYMNKNTEKINAKICLKKTKKKEC